MPINLTDQLFQEDNEQSLTDQLFKGPSDNLTDQLFQSTDAPTTDVPTEIFSRSLNNQTIFPGITPYKGKAGAEYANEFGQLQTSVNNISRSNTEKFMDSFIDTIKGYSSLATKPLELYRGAADFVFSIPGFMAGLVGATGRMSKGLLDQLLLGNELNLEEIYNLASEGMAEGVEFFEPGKEALIGQPTKESELVGQTIMAVPMLFSEVGNSVASSKYLEDYPNIRGAARFIGDIAGLVSLGFLAKKGRNAITKKTEYVTKEASKVVNEEQNLYQQIVEGTIEQKVAETQRKILQLQKERLENIAKEVTKDLSQDTLIKEDLYRKAEQIALEKSRPVKSTGINRPNEPKIRTIDKELGETIDIEIPEFRNTNEAVDFGERATTEQVTKLQEQFNANKSKLDKLAAAKDFSEERQSRVYRGQFLREAIEASEGRHPSQRERRSVSLSPGQEGFTERRSTESLQERESNGRSTGRRRGENSPIDDHINTDVELEAEGNPFFQNKETAEVYRKLYEERTKAVSEDPELYTQKLINDVNRWYHGDDAVDISTVRDQLSTLAARGNELRQDFMTGADHFAWMEAVSEAASWARKTDRKIIKRTETKLRKKGIKLTSGIDPTEVTKDIISGAKKVAEYTKLARGLKRFKPSDAAKVLREEFNRAFVDRSGNIRRELLNQLGSEGYETVQKMYLSKGASSISANMLRQMQKEVYSGLTRKERTVLDNLILTDRMIDIGKYKRNFKFPEEIDPKNSVAYSELVGEIEGLSSQQVSRLRNRTKAYFEWMKRPLKDMLDAELISQEEYNNLVSHNYRRLKIADVYDRRYRSKLGKRMRTVYDSGVEALARGRDTDIFEPSSEIMALEVFNRAYGRILNNDANRNLLEVARINPDNPFVRVKTKDNPIPTGWNRTFVYEGGQRKAIYLSPEMSKEWITNSPEMSYRLSQTLRFVSGSPVLRTFATGINWGFALANLPRDVMHAWFAARSYENGEWKSIYNPVLPIYGLQIARDLKTVFTDSVTRGKRYQDYINQGGGMEFLVHQGRLLQRGRHLEGPLDKVQNFFGYFGETSEIMTRLAIRERALRLGKSEQEATFIARDYMDFAQGGWLSKSADNAIPYLNAAIQGTRGMLRSFKDSPWESSFKLSQFAALTTGIYIANRKSNPETMKALEGNIDMQNNLIIPMGDQFGFLDEKGQKRYPYIKIPLDPGQKFFKTFFEASADKWLGNDIDVDRVVDSLKEQSPVGVTELPPTLSGALGYITNKDFWLNEDIWRQTDKTFSYPQSREEYIPGRTPEAYIDFGQATGLSPERTRYAVEELVTNGTIWSYLLNLGYEKAFGDLPKDKKEQHLARVLAETPVLKRFIGVTNPYSQFAENISSAKESSELNNWIENRELDRLVEGYLYEDSVNRKEIGKYINSFKDKNTIDRLKDRFIYLEKIKSLPNRSLWKAMKGLDAEARAKVFVDRLDESTPEQRKELYKEMQTVINAGGVITESFRREVDRLRSDR